MTKQHYLHVKIGPVQAFIRQARRTRDVWAGSFLLSWLSGKAMLAAEKAGGEIIRPSLGEDVFWKALGGPVSDECRPGPQIATLPNKFTVQLNGVDGREVGKAVEKGLRDAWTQLADAVWDEFLKATDQGNKTQFIWNRQIGSFWNVVWTVDEDIHGTSLSAREHWRYPRIPRHAEGGDHCSIMGDWQELSGHVRAKGERSGQDAFWDDIRNRISKKIHPKSENNSPSNLEIGRSERLCAIALVKRLFPLLAPLTLQRIIGWVPLNHEGGKSIDETSMKLRLRKYPSTAYMAAVPWLLKSWNHPGNGQKECGNFLHQVHERAKKDSDPDITDEQQGEMVYPLSKAEHGTSFNKLADLGAFGSLDGTLFFAEGIARRRSEMRANAEQNAQSDLAVENKRQDETVKILTSALHTLQKATAPEGGRRQRKMVKASPFYALLRMDGDRVGEAMKTAPDASKISQALAVFTQGDEAVKSAQNIVGKYCGLTLYSGGDDVLALLPLHTALRAADCLRRSFASAMHAVTLPPVPTLSGGLVFAHYTVPLGLVLDRSKDLLEKQAKEANGRNSLAIAVLKNSGEMANWVSCWDLGNDGKAITADMEDLIARFAKDDERSSSLLHNLRDRYADILGPPADLPLTDDDLHDILLAERLKGKDAARMTPDQREAAETEVKELMNICRPLYTERIFQLHSERRRQPFTIDGALIAKFLADNGAWYTGAPPGEAP